MSDESKSTETKSETTATPAATTKTTTTTTKSGGSNKGLLIILIIIALLCCLASLIGGGAWFMNYMNGMNSGGSTTEDSTTNNNNGGGSTTPTNPSDGSDTDEDEPADDGDSTGGEFIDIGGNFQVRVDSVRENGDDVEVSMSVKNDSLDPQTFSTLLFLSLVSDTNPDGYVQNFFSARYQEEGVQLDGEIAAGGIDQGVVVYRVDDNPSYLTLRVADGLFSDEYVEIPIM